MSYDRTKPGGATKVRSADNKFRDNWLALEDALNREHIFDGDGSSDEGQHRPGRTPIVFATPASAVSGVSATLGVREGEGALVYCTDQDFFLIWDGTAWSKKKYLKSASSGDTITTAWTVDGEYIDGRDPSVDGAVIDTLATSADYSTVAEGTAVHGSKIAPLTGFERGQCTIFVHNCGVWNLGAGAVRSIDCRCSATGGEVTSTIVDNVSQVQYPTVYYIIVCTKY